jgi:integrase
MSYPKLNERSGKYEIRWLEGGHHRQRSFTRKKDAQEAWNRVQRLKETGDLGVLSLGSETLGDFADRWLEWKIATGKLSSPKSRRNYRWLLDKHIDPYIGGYKLSELRPRLIEAWQLEVLSKGTGRVSVAKAGALLHGILKRAVALELIASNPAAYLEQPSHKRAPAKPLEVAEIERIRQALRNAGQPGDATLVSVLAYAGLRPYNEALALGWEQLTNGRLLVERKLVDGKLRPGTKTDKARSVRLLPPLAQDLNEWRIARGRPAAGLVFPRQDGKPWSEHDYGNWRRRVFGVHSSARPYDLRHTFASLLIWEGRPITHVAQQLGHSPQTCLTTYAHVMEGVEANVPAETVIRAARADDDKRLARSL